MKKIEVLRLANGKEPFEDWMKELSLDTRAIIDSHIDRVSMGGDKDSQFRDIIKAK